MTREEIEQTELQLLIEAIRLRRGYDFSNYAMGSLRRRLANVMTDSGVSSLADLIPKVIHDDAFFDRLVLGVSVTVTAMFRDPHFYRCFRDMVVPVLRTFPVLKFWHAGCASGQEPYSMAILLHEEGLLERSKIYATDFNANSIAIAKRAVFPSSTLESYENNYVASGGTQNFTDYFHQRYDSAKLDGDLAEKVTFANHNLVSDTSFGEVQVIICRNVLIYFDRTLQNRVLNLFSKSLTAGGFLCLGDKETLPQSAIAGDYETVSRSRRVFRKQALSKIPHAAEMAS